MDTVTKKLKKGTKETPLADITTIAAWSPEIGVSRAAWHPNINRSCLLASGMLCGLVRVDWMEGEEAA
jgi:hypothetical protein